MKLNKKHLLNCLKAISLLLIINSHSDVFFPNRIRLLATGGALGNSIFFIISGYLVTVEKNRYIWRKVIFRFFRLYIPVYITLILYCTTERNYLAEIHDALSAFKVLFWPTPYWFVSTSFMSYIFLILCKKSWIENSRQYIVFSIILLIVYLFCYVFGIKEKYEYIVEDGYIFGKNIQFKCIYNFYLFSLGYHVKLVYKQIQGNKFWLLTVFSLIMFYLTKYLLQINALPMEYQIVTHIFVITTAFGALEIALGYEKHYIRMVGKRIIDYIDNMSSISLEAYVTQLLIIPIVARMNFFKFPFNYLLSVCLILVIAKVLYLIDKLILKRLRVLLLFKNEN